MSAKIKKIEVEFKGGRTIEMNIDEAKELFFALKEMFDKEKFTYVPISYPVPYHPRPWYPYTDYPSWTITCGSTSLLCSSEQETKSIGY